MKVTIPQLVSVGCSMRSLFVIVVHFSLVPPRLFLEA